MREPDVWTELCAGRVPGTADADGAALVERYGPLVSAGPRVAIAQLGQSLDGFIAARTGDAHYVTGEEDRAHLHRLRALVDAVVVGWRTVAADDPRLTVRACTGAHPVRVILDAAARVPTDATVLHDGTAPTLWLVGADSPRPASPAAHVEVIAVPGLREADPGALLALLAERGLSRVLVEGGGVTVSRFIRAGALDRLYLTTAPLLVGDGVPGIRFDGEDRLADAVRGPVRRFVLGDDLCTEFVFRP